MGSEDIKRQSPNVHRMQLLGARVAPVESGSTLKDALNEALRDWVTNVENTFYIIGTVAGRSLPDDGARLPPRDRRGGPAQMPGRSAASPIRSSPASAAAATRWASSTVHPARGRRLIGVEAAGPGHPRGEHAARSLAGTPGVLHGNRTYLLQDQRPDHRDAFDLGRASTIPASVPSTPT